MIIVYAFVLYPYQTCCHFTHNQDGATDRTQTLNKYTDISNHIT